MKKIMVLGILLGIFVLGCSTTETEAITIAEAFVQEHVRFFTNDQNTSTDFEQVKTSNVRADQRNGIWYVTMHVEANYVGETKDNDIVIGVNKKGSVVSLNGKQVPQ